MALSRVTSDLTGITGRYWERSSYHDQVSLVRTGLLIAAMSLIMWCAWKLKKSSKEMKLEEYPLPPGPRGLPLLGNLPFLDTQLHTYFTKLNRLYGPVFKLKLGSKLVVVIGSTASAKEVLKDQDAIFANRDNTRAILALSYGGSGVAFCPYGSNWRTQRTAARELLSKTSLEKVYILQRREIRRSVRFMHSKVDTPINISDQIFLANLNIILTMMWGGTLSDDELISTGKEFRIVLHELVRLLGTPNLSDYFPLITRFDVQGVERRSRKVFIWFDNLMSSVIDDRMKLNQANEGNKGSDLLDILLKLKEKEDPNTGITLDNMKAMFQDMMLAGTDATATAFEWAMAEIMAHPEILKRIEEELEAVVGRNNVVEMSHIPKLHFLDAVLKETLRLHPVGPILLPRSPSKTTIVAGYTIPKGTQIMVNVWGLQTDPEVWENPLEFRPDRFLDGNSKWDYSGNDLSYIPFGSGRRICAGTPLAETTAPYALASFLHSFDWRLPEGVKHDLSATMGISLRKSTPLIAIPTPRSSSPEFYL